MDAVSYVEDSPRAVVWISRVDLYGLSSPADLVQAVRTEGDRLSFVHFPLLLDLRGISSTHPLAADFGMACRLLRVAGVRAVTVLTDDFGVLVRIALDLPMTFLVQVIDTRAVPRWEGQVATFLNSAAA